MAMEKTLVLIKPDAFAKKHVGDIIKIYEGQGFDILAMKMLQMDEKIASKHYEEHIGRPYYPGLIEFMTSAPLVAIVLRGEDAIARIRALHGKTKLSEAAEGTIRKMYADSDNHNAVHASDCPENAAREIAIFFNATEIYE